MDLDLDSHALTLFMNNDQARQALADHVPLYIVCMLCILVGSVVFGLMAQETQIISGSLLESLTQAYTEYLERLLPQISDAVLEVIETGLDPLKGLFTYLNQIDEVNGRIIELALGLDTFNTTNPSFVALYEATKDIDNSLSRLFDALEAVGCFDGPVLLIG